MGWLRTCPVGHGRMGDDVRHWHTGAGRECAWVWKCPVCFHEYAASFACPAVKPGAPGLPAPWWWLP